MDGFPVYQDLKSFGAEFGHQFVDLLFLAT